MHLFVTQFLKDLLWFTSHWADTSKETAGQYTYTEVRDARSGAFLYNKDHTPTGAIATFLMLAFAPFAIGEVARWLLINPVIASFGFPEIPFGSGVPALLTASIGVGLFWYLAKITYQVGVRFTGKTEDSAAPRTLGEMLTPDPLSLFLVSRVPAFVIAPWLCLAIIVLVIYWVLSSLLGG